MKLMHTRLGEVVIEEAIRYALKEPERNMGKLLGWSKKLCIRDKDRQAIESLEKCLEDPESNWSLYVKKLLNEIDPDIIIKMGTNFFFNASIFGLPMQKDNAKKYGCSIPWAILIEAVPGGLGRSGHCSSGEADVFNLEYEVMDRIINEGKQLGIFMYGFSGGEPLMRKDEIIALCKKHDSCAFMLFTGGEPVDRRFAEALKETGNIAVLLKSEGSEAQDKTVFEKMDLLRESRCLFGFFTEYGRSNMEALTSQEYIETMLGKGCRFGLYFPYIPAAGDEAEAATVTAEQKAYIYGRVREIREKYPLLVWDTVSDREYTNGCMGAGKRYFHINAKGECEPCAFVHYSSINIKEHTLIQALKSPLFKCFRKRQPFSRSPLRACPLLDKPEKLKAIIEEAKAYPTDNRKEETEEQYKVD